MTWLLVIAGGMVGAPLRFVLDHAVRDRSRSAFPWGTFTVNVTGCLLIGLFTGVAAELRPLLASGLCGALTTYSTFSWETLKLAEGGARLTAFVNVGASVLAGLGATCAGVAIAEAWWA
ncbi:fluoride efflux transporter FluC [Streptomyces litchfieldiae]|uniref:Fluoride-specific ion channel FluC n=1 Tax=Streptomyces litchfieldiae TaxID=3075543 RepID=A0ABU2MKZ7_9ACTN|nr:CrcB family protein [Streptomyces sp. DSM 44938]MDT0341804.1 CrcB family protein [Streptomyces sp. DSM 44938]